MIRPFIFDEHSLIPRFLKSFSDTSFFQAAAQCYIDLIIKESDNNVKLIVLDRLIELKEHPTHERVLQVHSDTTLEHVLRKGHEKQQDDRLLCFNLRIW